MSVRLARRPVEGSVTRSVVHASVKKVPCTVARRRRNVEFIVLALRLMVRARRPATVWKVGVGAPSLIFSSMSLPAWAAMMCLRVLEGLGHGPHADDPEGGFAIGAGEDVGIGHAQVHEAPADQGGPGVVQGRADGDVLAAAQGFGQS